MKCIVLVNFFLLIIFTNGYAQKVTTHVDDFTGEKVVVTSWEKIYQGGMTGMYQTRMRLKQDAGRIYFEFRIYTKDVASCSEGNKILFKTNKGVISVSNSSYTLTKPGDWSPSPVNDNLGIYLICHGNIEEFKDVTVQKIRITFNDGYVDLDLKKKESEKITKLCNKFIESTK